MDDGYENKIDMLTVRSLSQRREICRPHSGPGLLLTAAVPTAATVTAITPASPPASTTVTSAPTSADTTPTPSSISPFVLPDLVFPGLFQHVVWHPQVFHRVAPHVHLRHAPKLARVGRRANHLLHVHIHPAVALDQVTVVRLAVLQFDQLR